ncbi:MAG: hypothetical protein EOO20_25030 [Chryseobacterium sp.]|nr:MAG: hypothetical protein EOO20_25030 [Chryseobacterium sp.]
MRKKHLVLGLILVGFFSLLINSCKKNDLNGSHSGTKNQLLNGVITVSDDRFLELRDKARDQFDFHVGQYYHGNDLLQNVGWDNAYMMAWDDGKLSMLFDIALDDQMNPEGNLTGELLVHQDETGELIYNFRLSPNLNTGITSVYESVNKTVSVGRMNSGVFEIMFTRPLQTMSFNSIPACMGCHGDSGGGYPDDYESTELDGVTVTGNRLIEPAYWPTRGPQGPPPVTTTPNPNIDNNPCGTFNPLLSNPAFRQRLQQLIGNTGLGYETGFNYDGTNFSQWYNGQPGQDNVTVPANANTRAWGHSHYAGADLPIFSPADIQAYYQLVSLSNAPMSTVAIVATPSGTYMMKVINRTQFGMNGIMTTSL